MVYSPVFISPIEASEIVNRNRFDIKASLRSFQDTLFGILKALNDPKAPLIIGGVYIAPEDKNSPAASLLIDNEVSRIENTQTALMGVFEMIFRLERNLTNM